MARSDTANQEEDDVWRASAEASVHYPHGWIHFFRCFSFGFVAQARIVLRPVSQWRALQVGSCVPWANVVAYTPPRVDLYLR